MNKYILSFSLSCLLLPLASCAYNPNGQTGGTITGSYLENSSVDVTFSSSDGSAESKTITLSGRYVITGECTVTDGVWASNVANQSVFLIVDGGSLTINNATINKTGEPSSVGDNQNFYGLNSAIVTVGSNALTTAKNLTINAEGAGSNAFFCGANAKSSISSSSIYCTGSSNSRGLHATYGGSIVGTDLYITTTGTNSAAVATDRGGGNIQLVGAEGDPLTLITSGEDSPCLYSTGKIIADYVDGIAKKAQAIVIEGSNVVKASNSAFQSNNRSSGYSTDWGAIMLYQSMSHDAIGGEPVLELINSDITNLDTSSPMVYVTNAKATIYFSGVNFYDGDVANNKFLDTSTTKWTSTNETIVLYLSYSDIPSMNELVLANTTSNFSAYLYDSDVTWSKTGSGTLNENVELPEEPILPY